jgi:hypothetical protein
MLYFSLYVGKRKINYGYLGFVQTQKYVMVWQCRLRHPEQQTSSATLVGYIPMVSI